MSAAVTTIGKSRRKKKFITVLTLILLLLLVSLLGGLSSQMSLSEAETGSVAAPQEAAPLRLPPTRPRPVLARSTPNLTPAEEILREIARYGSSAATDSVLPAAGSQPNPALPPRARSEIIPPLASDSPAGEAGGSPDDPSWLRFSHTSLMQPRWLGGDGDCDCAGDCPCTGGTSCPEAGWPELAELDPPDLELFDPAPGAPDGSLPPIGGEGRGAAPPVPEPATLLLVGTGMVCLAGWSRRHRHAS